jgi:hypothetical protein
MIYLSGCLPSKPELRTMMQKAGIGVLTTYRSVRFPPDDTWVWAADNGCFSPSWKPDAWKTWIVQVDRRALFAAVPDTVGDWQETRYRWIEYSKIIKGLGLRAAYVIQDGQPSRWMPWDDLDAVFIGGSTEWKLSDESRTLVNEARDRGKWVHMGRVNSLRRMMIARDWGCDSSDGTYLAFGPDVNTPKLVRSLDLLKTQVPLSNGSVS